MIDALPLLLGPEGYLISRSVRLRSSASAYLNRTPGSASNRTTWTWSGWVKRGTLGVTQWLFDADNGSTDSTEFNFAIGSGNTLSVSGSLTTWRVTTQVFRDPSAWYHIVLAIDTTQATANNRIRLYVNGSEVTAFSTLNNPTQNLDLAVNQAIAHYIGIRTGLTSPLDGYLTEVNFIDGQALTPSSFGETNPVTGVWQPKKYAGTYGTNGFYLNFSDNSAATAAAIGKDNSGNGNNWTPNNISVTAGSTYDSMLDVPTQWADGGNGRGNYAVLNPLDKTSTTTTANGNLGLTLPANVAGGCGSTMAVSSGQWYVEVTPTSGSNALIGIVLDSLSQNGGNSLFSTGYGYYQFNGNKYVNGTASAYGSTYAANDVIGIALDLTNLTLTFYKNNTSQGAISIAAGSYKFTISNGSSTVAQVSAWNFGQRPFSYTPPTGFKALNTLNLPTPTILKGNQYFDAVTYAGSASQQTITTALTGLDFAWIKNRTTARDHVLVDTVRGGSPLLTLYSDLTAGEDNTSPNYNPTSFTTSGIVLGGAKLGINNAGENFVLWGWKEGATQGFDIVAFTNTASSASFNHNLGVTPAMIILKGRGPTAANWTVFHKSLANMTSAFLNLNGTGATGTLATAVPAPTSTTFGSSSAAIPASENSIAYLFSEVAGFSKAFSYTGNGSADGPFIFTDFRPRWVLIKCSSAGSTNWILHDTAREPYNLATASLYPNLSNAETVAASQSLDILSNGFKLRNTSGDINSSGATYIGFAMAENPFKFSLGR